MSLPGSCFAIGYEYYFIIYFVVLIFLSFLYLAVVLLLTMTVCMIFYKYFVNQNIFVIFLL